MEMVTIKATPRKKRGTRDARKLRTDGLIPAVVYGHGETPEHVTLAFHEVELALAHGARTLTLDAAGKKQTCLIKEVQHDHLDIHPIHVDLARVSADERVRVKVGIELRGTPKGISEGGVIDQVMGEIEVECLVFEIPDVLHPVVTHLGLGESLRVKDLVLPPGVTPLADPEDRVASVRLLAIATEAAPAAEGEEAAVAEPERIGRIRKEEGEEEGEKKA
jgi:large subunit ribosomal protein L25